MGNSPKGEYMLKKNKILNFIGIGIFCLFLFGCSKESFLLSSKDSSSTIVLKEEILLPQETSEMVFEESKESEVGKIAEEKSEEIAVHICGAVNNPGVYYFKEKQRVHEGIVKAGGFREDADMDYLNQALFLEDGMKIIVPTKEETKLLKDSKEGNGEKEFLQGTSFSTLNETKEQKQKINLNTADKALLCTLPGIGESRAESILAYRQEHGDFEKTEDIMKVSGIKEAAYEKIKEYVTVSK